MSLHALETAARRRHVENGGYKVCLFLDERKSTYVLRERDIQKGQLHPPPVCAALILPF